MNAARNRTEALAPVSVERRRDEGAILPLVLVMMVISALIVVPMLSYTVSVLRANTVVVDSTRQREAAEAGVRVALLDPAALFTLCDGSMVPVPDPPAPLIDGISVSTSCQQVEEIGPLNVLGFQSPIGSTATQLGAELPDALVGSRTVGPVVPSYPTDPQWWSPTATATEGEIWMPDLPTIPGSDRTATPFSMPGSYDCTVFLPGHYTDALAISSGNVYFASGVYYFEDEVLFTGDANVVIGYGLEGLPSECADDVQVGANLIGAPATFDIDGGGATFVFGADGHLVIDNSSTTTGLSVRFNQRYAEVDQGGRVSIMSVNGDDLSENDHVVDRVVGVPRSSVTIGDTSVPLGGVGADYTVSSSRFTSAARDPEAPTGLTVTHHRTSDPSPYNGAVIVSWDEVVGQAAGGAPIDAYTVEWTSTDSGAPGTHTACLPNGIVSPAAGRLACMVTGLKLGKTVTASVTATNAAGFTSPAVSAAAKPITSSPSVVVPDAPTDIVVTPYDEAAGIGWTVPVSDGGGPITGYAVTAERVYLAEVPPVGGDDDDDPQPPVFVEEYEVVSGCATAVTGWQSVATECVVLGLPDLAPVDALGNTNVGYRFVVTATSAAGTSVDEILTPTPEILAFDGPAVPAPTDPLEQIVEPWIPEPIVDIRLSGSAPTTVSVPGYVSVPMGRVSVINPNGQDVNVNGGLLVSTLELDDSRATAPESVMVGYQNDIVLQRSVRIVATAGRTTASAVVQINEDGRYAVNSWVVQ